MATTGRFECSDEILNAFHRNAYWGIRGNYRGMPTDCPQRDERMGWLGDRGTGCYGEAYLLDNEYVYNKWAKIILQRLFRSELEKWNKEVERVQKKLSNEGFVKKAPEKVINEERAKEQDYLEKRAAVEARINELKG